MSRGRLSKPANRTATIPALSSAARMRNDDLLIGSMQAQRPALPAPVHCDVGRVNGLVLCDGERLAFGFANAQEAFAILRAEFPVVEYYRLGLIVAPAAHFAAQLVHPRGVVVHKIVR